MTYSRFVVISAPRTGSNLLMSRIRSHPNMVTYSEIFNGIDRENLYQNICHVLPIIETTLDEAMAIRAKSKTDFLEQVIFKPNYPNNVKAVGFKITYEDLLKNEQLQNHIINTKGIRLIHLVRQNLFDVYVSFRRAMMTNEWVIHEGTSRRGTTSISFHVDIAQCERFFENTAEMRDSVRSLIINRKAIELEYNEVAQGKADRDLQQFLEVKEVNLYADILKIPTIQYHSLILNYKQIREYFKKTRWSSFFDLT